MKRKFFGGTLIVSLAVIAAVCGFIFSSKPLDASTYAEGFEYNGPSVSSSYKGSYKLGETSDGTDQRFNLGVRSRTSQYTPDAADTVTPVFNNSDMQRIVFGGANSNVNYGFAMIESNQEIVLEITNTLAYEVSNTYVEYNYANRQTNTDIVLRDIGNEELLTHARLQGNTGKLWRNNRFSIIGVFREEGFYSFYVECVIRGDKSSPRIFLKFSFYITHSDQYDIKPILVIDDDQKSPFPLVASEYEWGAAGRFFYNFNNSTAPYVRYHRDRYDVNIIAKDFLGLPSTNTFDPVDDVDGVGIRRWNFKNMGDYFVSARMTYFDWEYRGADGEKNAQGHIIGRRVTLPYSIHEYSLNAFGGQAFYENYDVSSNPNDEKASKQLLFGGKDDPYDGVENYYTSADISGIASIKPNPTQPNRGTPIDPSVTINPNIVLKSGADGIIGNSDDETIVPVITNSPPVSIKANVVSFGETYYNDGSGWVKEDVYDKDGFYERAGEYFIVMYYTYSVGDASYRIAFDKPEGDIYHRQVFYFKIIDFVDVRIQTSDIGSPYFGREFSFSEFALRRAEIQSGGFIVYLHNYRYDNPVTTPLPSPIPQTVGPYEIAPRIELAQYDWNDVKIQDWNTDVDSLDGKLAEFTDAEDGRYVFRVYYGNKRASRMDFTVVVDTAKASGVEITSTGKTIDTINVDNFGIFGSGEVSVAWDNKASGVDFNKTAYVKRYNFVYDETYAQHNDIAEVNMVSPYMLSDENPAMWPTDIKKTADGWHIPEKFTESGVYFIDIPDFIGNQIGNISTVVFIIDDTPAGFAQDPVEITASNSANIVKGDVTVVYGYNKRVRAEGLRNLFESHSELDEDKELLVQMFASLKNKLFFDYERHHGVSIPAIDSIGIGTPKHEISEDNVNFETLSVSSSDYEYNGVRIKLTTDGFYYLRTTDILGNVTPYYIWRNSDENRSLVVENSVPSVAASSATASIVRPDGMARSEYVYYSFMPQGEHNGSAGASGGFKFIADEIRMTYYPFDLDSNADTNPNYPFSAAPDEDTNNTVIWSYAADRGKTWDNRSELASAKVLSPIYLPLNPGGTMTEETRKGLYIITRYQDLQFNTPAERADSVVRNDQVRNYFFIVDDNKIVPTETGSEFQSDFRLNFGEKLVRLEDLNNNLETNAAAEFTLPKNKNKYGGNTTLTGLRYVRGYTGFVTPSKQSFNMTNRSSQPVPALSLNAVLEHNGQEVADIVSLDSKVWDTNGRYRLTLTDGSGGVNWIPYGEGSRVVSPNTTVISFDMLTGTAPVKWWVNGQLLHVSRTSAKVTPKSLNPDSTDTIEFEFINNIDYYAFINEVEVLINGGKQSEFTMSETYQTSPGIYRYNLTGRIVNDALAKGNESIGIRVHSDGIDMIEYGFIIDNEKPKYNLGRIKSEEDTLQTRISDKNDSLNKYSGNFADGGGKYIYAIGNDFAFEEKPVTPPFHLHDTYSIEYQQVSADLSRVEGPHVFYTYGNIPFAKTVGLQSNETRFYLIKENDEAGNFVEYYVQLRGDSYVNNLPATGLASGNNLVAVRPLVEGGGWTYGLGIHAGDLTDFWTLNSSFYMAYKIGKSADAETVEFTRIKDTDLNPSVAEFKTFLETMLRAGTDNVIIFEFNDRFDTKYFHIAQAGGQTELPKLTAQKDGEGGNDLRINIENRDKLRGTFDYLELKLQVFRIVNGVMSSIAMVDTMFQPDNSGSMTLPSVLYSEIGNDELVLRVTDSFGRTVLIEHHGKNEPFKEVTFNGNIGYDNKGVRYMGHEDGVEIRWNPNVYYLEVNSEYVNGYIDEKTGNEVYVIKPDAQNPNGDLSAWLVSIRYRATGLIMQQEEWKFYYTLPQLEFKNRNGTSIDAEISAGEAAGVVEVTLDRSGFLFESSITYTREYGDGLTESVVVGDFAQRFVLEKVGNYTITVVNEVSTRELYRFAITDVNNLSYKVMFREQDSEGNWAAWKELQQSPVQFKYTSIYPGVDASGKVTESNIGTPQSRPIPVYWAKGASAGDVTVSDMTAMISVGGNIQIIPSINNDRKLVRISGGTMGDIYYQYYFLYNTISGTRLYFAIACTLNTAQTTGETSASTVGLNISQTSQDDGAAFRLFRNIINTNGIQISLNKNAQSDALNLAYTNVYYADLYHNGSRNPVRRIFGGETLTINEADYGVLEFHIYDWAGNKRIYEVTTNDEEGNEVKTFFDYYTVYNFSRAPILVNGETIIDNMVYTESETMPGLNISSVSVGAFVNQASTNFFIKRLYVERNGVALVPEGSAEGATEWFTATDKHDSTFTFNESGRYYIECEYDVGRRAGEVQTVKTQHFIEYISTNEINPSFSYNCVSNINIVSVKYFGTLDRTSDFGTAPMKNIKITAADGPGLYSVTFEVVTNLRKTFTITRDIMISEINPAEFELVSSNIAWGSSHIGTVSLVYNPLEILTACSGEADLIVMKNGVEEWREHISPIIIDIIEEPGKQPVEVPWYASSGENRGKELAGNGSYQVLIVAANGSVEFYQSFKIGESLNQMIWVIIVGVIGVVIVGIILFIKMRTRMRVK